MDKKLPNITDAEWSVMEIIWSKKGATARQVLEELEGVLEWSPTTVYTLISRLEKKNVIKSVDGSAPKNYYPLIAKSQYKKEETNSFLNRLYNGSMRLFLTSFVKEGGLSPDELKELRDILDENIKNGGE